MPQTAPPSTYTVDLSITGMTCASCVSRVERRLNALDGVEATVNLPLESAHVTYTGVQPSDQIERALVAAVATTGYGAEVTHPGGASRTGRTVAGQQVSAEPQVSPTGHDDLAPHHDGHDHGDPTQDDTPKLRDLRRRLIVSVPLAIPVVAVSMISALHFAHWQLVMLIVALPVIGWGAWPFHRAALINARHRASTMDTLVSLGIAAATVASVRAAISGGESYLEVAVTVSVFLLAGRYAEAKATHSGATALRALLDLGAKDVAVLRFGLDGAMREERVPVSRLGVGSEFVVRPGDTIATDGIVVSGASAVDTSILTGEPVPVDVGPGDAVTGATIATTGRIVVRATAIGEQTRLAQIGRLVTSAQTGKAAVQRLADRISAVFVPVVLLIAAGTFAGWVLTTHDVDRAFTAAVAVLVIACPCALGLATPTALLTGTGRGAQLGLLIRGPQVLEQTRRVDTVVLDKTGTVTTGRMSVVDVRTFGADAANTGEGLGRGEAVHSADALRLAGAVEATSSHPLAIAICDAARAVDPWSPLPEPAATVHEAGLGVAGVVEGRSVIVGRATWLADRGIAFGAEAGAIVGAVESRGSTAVAVAVDDQVAAVIEVADTVAPTSRQAVERLQALGLRPILLTGDNPDSAAAAARAVGIDEDAVVARVLPEGKVAAITELQSQGRVVAMIGDGVNDAAALAQADLGIAMGTGTDVAIAASDLTLMRADLDAAVDAVLLSRATLKTIKVNLIWAFAYNVAAIPLAAAGLLSPMIAGAAMALSSVLVVTNSLRLRRWTP